MSLLPSNNLCAARGPDCGTGGCVRGRAGTHARRRAPGRHSVHSPQVNASTHIFIRIAKIKIDQRRLHFTPPIFAVISSNASAIRFANLARTILLIHRMNRADTQRTNGCKKIGYREPNLNSNHVHYRTIPIRYCLPHSVRLFCVTFFCGGFSP